MYHIMIESGLNSFKIALNNKLWNIVTATIANAGTQSTISAQIYRPIGREFLESLDIKNKNYYVFLFLFFIYFFSLESMRDLSFLSFFFSVSLNNFDFGAFLYRIYDTRQDLLKNINIFFIRVTQCKKIALILMRGSANRSPVKN